MFELIHSFFHQRLSVKVALDYTFVHLSDICSKSCTECSNYFHNNIDWFNIRRVPYFVTSHMTKSPPVCESPFTRMQRTGIMRPVIDQRPLLLTTVLPADP